MAKSGSSTRETSTSVTGLLEVIDWAALPAETRQTIRMVGPLLVEGCSRQEIGRRIGVSDATVGEMVAEVRAAFLGQAERMLDDLEPRMRARVEELRAATRR